MKFSSLVLTPLLILLALVLAPSAQAADMAAAQAYVPSEAAFVAQVDVGKLKKSSVYKKVVAMVLDESGVKDQLDEVKKQIGFDVTKDVKALVVAAGSNIQEDDSAWVAIVEAKVDEKKTIRFIKKKGSTVSEETTDSGKIYVINSDSGLAWRGKHVLMGGLEMLKKALTKSGMQEELKTALADYAKREVAMAGILSDDMRNDLGEQSEDLKHLKVVGMGISLESGLDLDAFGKFKTAAAASRMAKLLNQAIEEAKQNDDIQRIGLAQILDRVQVTTSGSKLKVNLSLSKGELEALIGKLESLL